jgi:hypothetical protein
VKSLWSCRQTCEASSPDSKKAPRPDAISIAAHIEHSLVYMSRDGFGLDRSCPPCQPRICPALRFFFRRPKFIRRELPSTRKTSWPSGVSDLSRNIQRWGIKLLVTSLSGLYSKMFIQTPQPRTSPVKYSKAANARLLACLVKSAVHGWIQISLILARLDPTDSRSCFPSVTTTRISELG